jgi:hypothetical protein
MTRFGDQFMSMDRSTLHGPLLTAAIVMMSSRRFRHICSINLVTARASILNAAMAFTNIREQALASGATRVAETALAMS